MAWIRATGGAKTSKYLYKNGVQEVAFDNGINVPSASFANAGGWTFGATNISGSTPSSGGECKVVNTSATVNLANYSILKIKYSDDSVDAIDVSSYSQAAYIFVRLYADSATDRRYYVEASTNRANYATGRLFANERKRATSSFTITIKEIWLE